MARLQPKSPCLRVPFTVVENQEFGFQYGNTRYDDKSIELEVADSMKIPSFVGGFMSNYDMVILNKVVFTFDNINITDKFTLLKDSDFKTETIRTPITHSFREIRLKPMRKPGSGVVTPFPLEDKDCGNIPTKRCTLKSRYRYTWYPRTAFAIECTTVLFKKKLADFFESFSCPYTRRRYHFLPVATTTYPAKTAVNRYYTTEGHVRITLNVYLTFSSRRNVATDF